MKNINCDIFLVIIISNRGWVAYPSFWTDTKNPIIHPCNYEFCHLTPKLIWGYSVEYSHPTVILFCLSTKKCNFCSSVLHTTFPLHRIKTWINSEAECGDDPNVIMHVMLTIGLYERTGLASKMRITEPKMAFCFQATRLWVFQLCGQ
jgi:hypothetical protein